MMTISRKPYKKTILYLATVFFFLCAGGMASEEQPSEIKVALNHKPSFPNRGRPGTENSQNPGVAFETLGLIEKHMNVSFVYQRLPYKRCLAYLESGRADAVMTASFKSKRERQGVYPKQNGNLDTGRRVYFSSYYLYIREDSKIRWDGKSFHNLDGRIGAELGFSIVDDLKKWGIQALTFNGPNDCFFLLHKGRLAGVAAHESTGQKFVYKYKTLKQISPPLISKPYFLIFSHQFYNAYPDLSEKIWNAIAELRQSTRDWKNLKEKYYSMEVWPEFETKDK